MMQKFEFPIHSELTGCLKERIIRSWQRLHQSDYQVENVFKKADCAWPGDYEGRLLLALSKLMRTDKLTSPTVEAMKQCYKKYCNAQGYLGPVHEDFIDEQQLAGHGWVLRSLSEMQLLQPSELWCELADSMVNGFKKLLTGKVGTYPVSDGERKNCGAVDGSADKRIGNWRVSTDVGAVFIFFDGLVQTAEVFRLDCRELIDEFYALAQKLDVLAVKAQTHATLTLCRGLLRYAEYSSKQAAEDLAVKLYELYKARGMTLNYANYNWFDRPEWTEPCAIVDSFIVTMELFRRTGNAEYLDDAHRIWFSGVERSQRQSGGFGGENCLTHREQELYMKFYEAPNCCNMRGAEGLYECTMKSIYRNNIDNVLLVALPVPGIFTFADGLTVEIRTNYPDGGAWQCKVLAPGKNPPKQIKVYRVNEQWRDTNDPQEYAPQKMPLNNCQAYTLWQGPVMLGKDQYGVLHKLNNFYQQDRSQAEKLHLQCIFSNQPFQ